MFIYLCLFQVSVRGTVIIWNERYRNNKRPGAYLLLVPQGRTFIRDRALIRDNVVISFLIEKQANVQNKSLIFTNDLIYSTSIAWVSLSSITSRAVATKFKEAIIPFENLWTHMDIIVEKLRRRPLFLYCDISVLLLWAIKGRSTSVDTYPYSNITILE